MFKIIDLSEQNLKRVISGLEKLHDVHEGQSKSFEMDGDMQNAVKELNECVKIRELIRYMKSEEEYNPVIMKIENSCFLHILQTMATSIIASNELLLQQKKNLQKFISKNKKGYCEGVSSGIQSALNSFDVVIKAAPLIKEKLKIKDNVQDI